MSGSEEKRFSAADESAILRDRLAADRTVLANERTFLAYIRTALTMFVAGVTFIHFFERDVYTYIGIAFIPLSAAIMVFGVWRFRHSKKILAEMSRRNGLL